MSTFLKQAIKYTLLIFILGYAIIYVTVKANPKRMVEDATEFEMWKYKKDLTNTHFNEHKNIIIGDSRAMMGIDPRLINHNYVNLAVSGSTAFEGYSAFKDFLQHNNVDTIVVCYGTFHFLESDLLGHGSLLYRFFPIEDLNQLEKVENKYKITVDNQPPGYLLSLERRATYYRFPMSLRPTFIENLKEYNYRADIVEGMKKSLGFRSISESDSSDATDREVEIALKEKKFIANPVVMSYVDSIYSLSMKKHITIALLIPPINNASYKVLKNTLFWQQFNKFKENLATKFPDMKVDNKTFVMPNIYFEDSSHLNRRGSTFLSNYVKNDLFGM